jgi:hypothetical protein
VEPEQINRILEEKRIPLTNLSMILMHYTMVFPALLLFFVFLYIYFDSGDVFGLFIAAPCLFLALFIIFYLGKKQLKLIMVQFHFADDRSAYLKAKEVFAFYRWDIIEENGINYIKALRADSFIGGKSPWKGRAVSIFIKQGYIYIISLYHPYTQADIFGFNARNVIIFERKIKELTLNK